MSAQPRDLLHETMLQAISRLDADGRDGISARDIANRTLDLIDPEHAAPALEQIAAIEGLSQRARAWLRGQRERDPGPAGVEAPPADLFEGDLPKRVPVSRGREDVYILRDLTTWGEVAAYIGHRRVAVRTEQRRLNALERWNEARR